MARTKKFRPLDLNVGEVGILSMIADYALVPEVKNHLEKIIKRQPSRIRHIGQHMLNPTQKGCKGIYARTAKRFLDANVHNVEQMRTLRLFTPRGLHFER